MLKTTKKLRRDLQIRRRQNQGFTAIEIAMVATVISILALIILPVFRDRVEEAKIAAAQADLAALMKQQQLVKADTGSYVRLQDLDNVSFLGIGVAPNNIDVEVPFFRYDPPSSTTVNPADILVDMTVAERRNFSGTADKPKWKGPYIAFQRHTTKDQLLADAATPGSNLNNAFSQTANTDADAEVGLLILPEDSDESRIPVDPWGNPYLFFPPTGFSESPTDALFPNAAIYSLGPNGGPGDNSQAGNANAWTRAGSYAGGAGIGDGGLGKDDDLMVQF